MGYQVHQYIPRATVLGVALAALLASVMMPAKAHAITTISQGFNTKDSLSIGSMVSLLKNTNDQVSAANTANVDNLFGVVITDGSSLLSLSTGTTKQVQVATSGVINVLVSDINGTINQSDQVTASPINGVGMKATNSAKVIGIAQGDLKDSRGTKQKIKDKDGKEQDVVLGEIPIQLNVTYFFKQPEKTVIPGAIQNVANALAGKTVKPLPIIISSAIFLVTLIVVASIIYSMIRSSIISVGRNPMAQSAVYRNVIQMSALVVGILGVAVVSIYMSLTKL